jgi:hypothetical protein
MTTREPRAPDPSARRRSAPLAVNPLAFLHRPRSLVAAALAVAAASPAPGAFCAAAAAGSPAATVALEELAVGDRGYGLSVFAGGEPERFEAEVIGVLRNLSPGASYILARLTGHGLETSGVVAGMSGSPVYFDGRLAGAVAFSWPFSREAVAGITPIAAMRRIPAAAHPDGRGAAAASGTPAAAPAESSAGVAGAPGAPGGPPPVSLRELAAGRLPPDLLDRELARLRPPASYGAAAGLGWSVAGFGPAGEALLARWLAPLAPAGEAAGAPEAPLAPGDAVAAVLIDGDFRMAASGTVTDVDGDALLAFGHPVLGLGPRRLPMAVSEVVTVLSNQQSSFKIANLGPVVGAFEEDRQAGLRGRLGAAAPTVPLRLLVRGRETREFRLRLAAIPEATPTLLAISSVAAIGSASYSAGAQGFDLAARFRLAGHGELALAQSFDGDNAATDVAAYLVAVAGYLVRNDFAAVELESIDVELTQSATPRTATLVGAHAERTVVQPGERIAVNLDLTAYRGEPFRRTLAVDLPADLPAGKYYLFVGDGPSVDAARMAVEKSEPVNLRQALELLRSLHSRRELVVMGVVEGPGLAVAGEVLPNLPGSVRSLWSAGASGSAVPLRLAVARQLAVPSDVPVEGAVRIDLRVERREPLTAGEPGGEETAPSEEGGGAGGEPAEPPPATAAGASRPAARGAR